MQNISADLKVELYIHGNMQHNKIHIQLIFITTHTDPSFHTTVLKKQRSITLGSLVYDPMQHCRKVANYTELHNSNIFLLFFTSTTILNLVCTLRLFLFFKQLSSLHSTECLSDILYGLHYSTNFNVNSLVVPHILESCIHSTTNTTIIAIFPTAVYQILFAQRNKHTSLSEVLAFKCTSLENKAFMSVLNNLCSMYYSENETAIYMLILNFYLLPRRQRQNVLLSERENQQDATVTCLLSTLSQHVSGIIMPIFRRPRHVLLHVVCCAVTSGEKQILAVMSFLWGIVQ